MKTIIAKQNITFIVRSLLKRPAKTVWAGSGVLPQKWPINEGCFAENVLSGQRPPVSRVFAADGVVAHGHVTIRWHNKFLGAVREMRGNIGAIEINPVWINSIFPGKGVSPLLQDLLVGFLVYMAGEMTVPRRFRVLTDVERVNQLKGMICCV